MGQNWSEAKQKLGLAMSCGGFDPFFFLPPAAGMARMRRSTPNASRSCRTLTKRFARTWPGASPQRARSLRRGSPN